MVLALSAALLACGDEKDSYAKKDAGDDGGRSRSSTGGKPGAGPDDEVEPGNDSEPDAGGPMDGSLNGADAEPGVAADGGPGTDGGADAGPAAPDGGDAGLCAAPGESCDTLDCCTDAICIIEPETGDSICASECSAPEECNSSCCVSVRESNVGACVPAEYCEATPIPPGSCTDLELIAEDGTFLGEAVSSSVAVDGVCNGTSAFGSSVGLNSIFNELSAYGSELGAQSAYNRLTTTPPALVCIGSNQIVAFVTKNQLLTGAELVDPDALCVVLANSGW